MNTHHYKLLFALIVILFLMISCQLPGGGATRAELPEIHDPTQSAAEVVSSVATQLAGNSKEFQVTLTESQINTLLSQELGKQKEPVLTNPQVDLKQDQMILLGQIEQNIIKINVRIVLEPAIDDKGVPNVAVVEADLGGIPVPQAMNTMISELFKNIILNAVSESGQNVKLETLSVSEDTLSISGKLK